MGSSGFDAWFARASGGRAPYDFQRDLAVAEELPDLLAVPTGSGKTAGALLSWVWRRRGPHGSDEVRNRTPRRLVYCLPMRTLVEQVHDNAVRWLTNLELLAPNSVDTPRQYRPSWNGSGIPVFRLMGGEQAVEWEAFPEREAILIGTQDMLLSRALNRGYAMYPCNWPIAFGLVNVDALWILDEVQLMGVGRTTSVQLQQFHRGPDHLPRRTLWMSATLGAQGSTERSPRRHEPSPEWMRTPERGRTDVEVRGLSESDRRDLAGVINAKKSIEPMRGSRTVEDGGLPALLCDRAATGKLVLVMVNQVERACDLMSRLEQLDTSSKPEILLLHSRFRPRERTLSIARLGEPTPANGRIVVSTQVLEAGVDLDADLLVTEICPWSSMVQRLGRLNRRGLRDGSVIVLDLPIQPPASGWPKKKKEREEAETKAREKASLPYQWNEIEDSRARLSRLGGDASIAAIEQVERATPFVLAVEGPVLREFQLKDVFDTDPDLSGGHLDVAALVRGAEPEVDVHVLWRAVTSSSVEAEPPPHPDELCRVAIFRLRELGASTRGWLLGLQRARKRSAAWREVTLGDPAVRPGDTLLLPVEAGGYDDRRGWTGRRNDRPKSWITIADSKRAWLVNTATGGTGETIESLDERVQGWAARDDDPRSGARRWMTLAEHLESTRKEAHDLGNVLVPEHAEQLRVAGHWHDLGKALEREREQEWARPFQEMLRSAGTYEDGAPAEGVIYAKSNRRGGRYRTPQDRFRHEVASSLAYLASGGADDLVAWLIMAHHGKVRLLPEPWNDRTMNDAAGVRPGDRIAADAAKLVGGDRDVGIDPELFLAAPTQPSWQGRASRLLTRHGPVLVAYLEALLRIADWRASR